MRTSTQGSSKCYAAVWMALALSALATSASAGETSLAIPARGGMKLPARLASPPGAVSKVVILIHGSGPHGMDGDLTEATRDKQPNKVFVQYSDALVERGFAVLRYDKRSFVWKQRITKDAKATKTKEFKTFEASPLEFFVDDAIAAVRWVRARFPKAKVVLLGVSQGTWVALQVAHRMPDVYGVGLVGFYTQSIETLTFEQVANRPIRMLAAHDKDGDGRFSRAELAAVPALAGLVAQMAILDIDGDDHVSFDEIRGGNLVNLLGRDMFGAGYRRYEAAQPTVQEILKGAKFKVAFFQGLLDNQTPAYHAHAIQILSQLVWKVGPDRMRFRFYPQLGHVLDRRDSIHDLAFRRVDAAAGKDMARRMADFF